MSDIRSIPDIAPDIAADTAPDYPLEARVHVGQPKELKALADPTRRSILDLVLDRAATTSELAGALGKPNGTIDHHVKVLADAGLIRVVRTRKVRAMTERFWGRTARTIVIDHPVDGEESSTMFVREALEELSTVVDIPDVDALPSFSTLRHARIPNARMQEFIDRLDALTIEFSSSVRGGDIVFGLLVAVYPTQQPLLP